MPKPRKPIAAHPGEILQEILTQNKISQVEIAQRIKVTSAKINEICRGKRGITADMAMKFGKVFQQDPLFWSQLQDNWDLSQLEEDDYASITPVKLRA